MQFLAVAFVARRPACPNMNGSVKPPPRVAIVTGAAQGIGAGIALRLAREGFALCLTDLLSSQDKLSKVASACRASGSSVFTVDCDVSREDQVAHLVKTCAEELGSLDGESSFVLI